MQGPHHAAQKSTKATLSDSRISFWKFWSLLLNIFRSFFIYLFELVNVKNLLSLQLNCEESNKK